MLRRVVPTRSAGAHRLRRCAVSTFLAGLGSEQRSNNIAIVSKSTEFSYDYVDKQSSLLASKLVQLRHVTSETRLIAGYNKASVEYVVTMIAAWKLGKTFMPLSPEHTDGEINYFVDDSGADLLINSDSTPLGFNILSRNESFRIVNISKVLQDGSAFASITEANPSAGEPVCDETLGALVLYTSGTTGRPKGALHSRRSVDNMVSALCAEWKYGPSDKILHFLPLHHLHGVLNKLLCVLAVGGTVEFMPSAKAESIWARLAEEGKKKAVDAERGAEGKRSRAITLFHAVPTIYSKMLEGVYGSSRMINDTELQNALAAIKGMRLMTSGSAALPDTIMDKWGLLTGQMLLERYGMTELGMVLSNPYEEEAGPGGRVRVRGHVGYPLRSVQCIIVDDEGGIVKALDTPGELRVKGPTVFSQYLNKPQATKEAFDLDGFFRTGDVAVLTASGSYKLLGRSSTDIIKSSGYKLSALDIERELLSHPDVLECAVVGVSDDVLGEKVVAVLLLRSNATSGDKAKYFKDIRDFLGDKLAAYKQPRDIIAVRAIPRNYLGKVNKKTLLADIKASNVVIF